MPRPLILVAEDDSIVAALIHHTLAGDGMRVVLADDGQDALAALSRHRPDVILLDAMMPRMDGFEALRRLKADPAHREIPVLMLTGLRQQKAVSLAVEQGAAGYLLKPFRPDHLIERVRFFVDPGRRSAAPRRRVLV